LPADTGRLLNESLRLQDIQNELSLVVCVEYLEWPVNNLCLIDEQNEMVFTNSYAFDLVPLHRHTFPGIFFHQDLLAADLIGEPFE
jgi:hypothetical protein